MQTPGAPLLSVTRSTTNSVTVSWPAQSDGWLLQETSALGTTNWANAATSPVISGDRKQVVVPSPTGNRFYRLKK